MEFIKMLLKPERKCFLCFNENKNMSSVFMNMEIEEKFFSASLNLANIVKYLFPSFDITFTQACENCSNLILRMYIIMRKNIIKKKILNIILKFFNKKLYIKSKGESENIYLNIDISKILSSSKEIKETNKVLECKESKEQSFSEQNSMETTMDHENAIEKQCVKCLKMFDSIKDYKKHIRTHKRKYKQKHYNCNYCDYKSLCKTSVQGHINKFHLKSRPHMCQICYKSFYHKKNLTVHVESHAQSRNEICDVCGERFIHKKNLLEHLKLHTGVRPYECAICGKKFITSGRRLEHVKRTHSEKTECCLLCDKKFSLTKELTRHMKSVHSSVNLIFTSLFGFDPLDIPEEPQKCGWMVDVRKEEKN